MLDGCCPDWAIGKSDNEKGREVAFRPHFHSGL
jgi:hypothetical protein